MSVPADDVKSRGEPLNCFGGPREFGVRTGKMRCLYLDDETVAIARQLGGGNVSNGLRLAIQAATSGE